MEKTEKTPEKKAAPKKAAPPPPPPFVYFESAEREPMQFTMMDVKPERLGNGKLRWEIEKSMADRARRHTFVQQGRIVEV